jgi:hypothetical protein
MAGSPTHAIVVRVTFKPGHEDAATKLLEAEVVPAAKRAPGFVAGYWMHAENHRSGTSVELFDGLEHAQAELGRRSVEMPPESPVVVHSVQIMEIVATG